MPLERVSTLATRGRFNGAVEGGRVLKVSPTLVISNTTMKGILTSKGKVFAEEDMVIGGNKVLKAERGG